MAVKSDVLPMDPALGKAVRWEIWSAINRTEHETYRSDLDSILQIPSNMFLGIRVYGEGSKYEDGCHRSDVCFGQEFYAIKWDPSARTVEVTRGDTALEVEGAAPNGAVFFEGYEMDDVVWDQIVDTEILEDGVRNKFEVTR